MGPRSALRSLRLLLFDPGEFFDDVPPARSAASAAAVVLATSTVLTAGVGAIGWLITSRIDVTVTETVMEPWPDWRCEGFDEVTPEPCTIDEPVTRQVDVGQAVWEEFVGYLPVVFVAALVGWVVVAAGLHVVSAVYDAEGGFGSTLAVAGWATVPQVFTTAVVVGVTWFRLRSVEFASDPDVFADQMARMVSPSTGEVGILVTLVVTVWQAYIWAHGLTRARDLAFGEAATVAGVVGVVSFLLSLA